MVPLERIRKTFLSNEESKRLGILVLNEDSRGYDGIIRWYWPYMCEIVREIARTYHVHDLSELESAGGEKLCKIVQKWDYRKAQFPAFAAIQLRRELKMKAFAMEPIPRKRLEDGSYPERFIPVLSLHETVKSEKYEDERELIDALENHDAVWPDHCIEVIDHLTKAPSRITQMQQAVAEMPCPHTTVSEHRISFEENKRIFLELYGLGDNNEEQWGLRKTCREMGRRVGKTHQRIEQIEKKLWCYLSSVMEYTREKLFEDIETITTFKKIGVI
jgi:hypothetical protein